MKFTALTAAAALVVLPALVQTAPVTAAPASFVGTWHAPTNTRGIAEVVIAGSGSSFTIHAYGSCTPSNCDLGTVPLATFSSSVSDPNLTDDGATASFTESFAKRTMTINLRTDGKLAVDTFTTFTDNSGRQNYEDKEVMTKSLTFVPGGPLPAKEDCISYNNSTLSINTIAQGYQLVSGSIALQLLDTEADALAAKAVAAAHTKQCFIGRDNTRSNRYEYIMEYWK